MSPKSLISLDILPHGLNYFLLIVKGGFFIGFDETVRLGDERKKRKKRKLEVPAGSMSILG